MRTVLAPSILSSDFARLGEECARLERAGADWIHVDVMDGHFVPNLTIGAPVVRAIRPVTRLPLDCHLMIEEPERYVDDFIEAGADGVTFHLEAVTDVRPLLRRIHDAGKRAGVALRPRTPPDALLDAIAEIDLVLVMTVEPGFGGQAFMEEPLGKIAPLRAAAERAGRALDVEVDGGIDLQTMPVARRAGANVFVAGSAIFGSGDAAGAIRRFQELLRE